MNDLLETAISAAQKSSIYLLQSFGTLKKVREKESHYSIVSDEDLASQAIIIDEIKSRFPEHEIVTEESEKKRITSNAAWVIDPIDGSSYYIRGIPTFSISIAFLRDHKVLIGVVMCPVENELFYAIKGEGSYLNSTEIVVSEETELRNSIISFGHRLLRVGKFERGVKHLLQSARSIRAGGSCAQELCYIACGRIEAALMMDQSIWDYAAGKLIVEEAGGSFSNFIEKEVNFKTAGESDFSIVASNGKIQKMIITLLSE